MQAAINNDLECVKGRKGGISLFISRQRHHKWVPRTSPWHAARSEKQGVRSKDMNDLAHLLPLVPDRDQDRAALSMDTKRYHGDQTMWLEAALEWLGAWHWLEASPAWNKRSVSAFCLFVPSMTRPASSSLSKGLEGPSQAEEKIIGGQWNWRCEMSYLAQIGTNRIQTFMDLLFREGI